MAKRTGLGRGIGALIPIQDDPTLARPVDVFFPYSEALRPVETVEAQDLLPVPGARLAHLDPADIVPNAHQPRSVFDESDLAELVHSIREVGVLQPIVVRPILELPGKYELVMGERRLRATKEVGLDTIPAIVRETADVDMLRDALLENLHRAQLNPLEEASAYQQLLADFGIAKHSGTEISVGTTSEVLGTPYYISPEQILGEPIDARCDLYSLGVIFHEMLTGRKPFHAGDAMALLDMHLEAPVPRLPQELADCQPVLDKLMAKEPIGRYANAAEALAAIGTLAQNAN